MHRTVEDRRFEESYSHWARVGQPLGVLKELDLVQKNLKIERFYQKRLPKRPGTAILVRLTNESMTSAVQSV